jgi:hypothetical protein
MIRKILKYSDPTKALAETDLDRIQKKEPEEATKDTKDSEVNEQTAAQLSFTLPASCYATMALRELMKISTTVRHLASSHSLLGQTSPALRKLYSKIVAFLNNFSVALLVLEII